MPYSVSLDVIDISLRSLAALRVQQEHACVRVSARAFRLQYGFPRIMALNCYVIHGEHFRSVRLLRDRTNGNRTETADCLSINNGCRMKM